MIMGVASPVGIGICMRVIFTRIAIVKKFVILHSIQIMEKLIDGGEMLFAWIGQKLAECPYGINNVRTSPKHGVHDATNVGLVIASIDLGIIE